MGDAAIYRIEVGGQLGPEWAAWFDGLAVEQAAGGRSILVGLLADQASLHGLLARIRDLGLPLLSVAALGPAPGPAASVSSPGSAPAVLAPAASTTVLAATASAVRAEGTSKE